MNRAERRAAARGGLISVMYGEPDGACPHCVALGLAEPVDPDDDSSGDGPGVEAVFTSFPPTP